MATNRALDQPLLDRAVRISGEATKKAAMTRALQGFIARPSRPIEAADARNACRRRWIEIGPIDTVLIQLCRRHDLVLLSSNRDFQCAAKHVEFRLWSRKRLTPQ